MKATFKIQSHLYEQELIEWCLNMHHSGYIYYVPLLFHALAKSWKIDKLMYYKNLIENS